MQRTIKIGGRLVGDGYPCYVVAEISANHNQSLERAIKIIHEAKRAGADAIKLQTYTADTLTIPSDLEWFRIGEGTAWAGKTLHELYSEAYTPWEWHPELKRVAESLSLDFFSTPFDSTAVDFLEGLNVVAYKVASFEIIDIPLLKRIGRTGKPVIVSTGMAAFDEIRDAVEALRDSGSQEIALLKCTSSYPAGFDEMRLRTIPHLAAAFGTVVGLSDHSMGSVAAVAGVALGAAIVEKHLTHRRADGGPDASFSMEPQEFADLAESIRKTEQALGEVSYELTPGEEKNRCFRRSLFAVEDIPAGAVLTEANVRSIRPAYGLAPRHWWDVVGATAARDIPRGTPLSWDQLRAKCHTDAAPVCVRPATPSDLMFYFALRNEPSVRATAFSTDEVNLATHKRWFNLKLTDANAHMFVVESNGEAVGQVRLDVSGDEGEIHIAISSRYRGHGYAAQALRTVCEKAFATRPQLQKIIARIKADNTASLRAFKSAGFTDCGPEQPSDDVCRKLSIDRATRETDSGSTQQKL